MNCSGVLSHVKPTEVMLRCLTSDAVLRYEQIDTTLDQETVDICENCTSTLVVTSRSGLDKRQSVDTHATCMRKVKKRTP